MRKRNHYSSFMVFFLFCPFFLFGYMGFAQNPKIPLPWSVIEGTKITNVGDFDQDGKPDFFAFLGVYSSDENGFKQLRYDSAQVFAYFLSSKNRFLFHRTFINFEEQMELSGLRAQSRKSERGLQLIVSFQGLFGEFTHCIEYDPKLQDLFFRRYHSVSRMRDHSVLSDFDFQWINDFYLLNSRGKKSKVAIPKVSLSGSLAFPEPK